MLKIFSLVLIYAVGFRSSRVDNICSTQHIKRVFIGLGEYGVLTGYNLTAGNGEGSSSNVSIVKSCQVEVVTCPSCALSLNFRFMNLSCDCGAGFNLFTSNGCRCDYVRITEPPYNDVSGISFCNMHPDGSLYNRKKNLQYRSKTRTARITLYYSRPYFHAFTLDYTSEPNRQLFFGTPQSLPHFNSSSGYISSPFFPAAYPPDLAVEYVISCVRHSSYSSGNKKISLKPDFNCRIRLTFTDFQLASASVLELYDGSRRIEVVSGSSFRPPVIISSKSFLVVRFYAFGENSLGFKALYSFLSEDDVEKTLKPTTDCGGSVENSGGTITMMNMVRSGMKLYDCVWLIRPSKNFFGLKTHLYLKITTFLNFAGEAELLVREGLTSESRILETVRYPVSLNSKEHVLPLKSGYYVSLRASFGPASHLAITYSSFSYNKCFVLTEFLCQNYRCISKKLTCDGFDHCGDNSDEPSTCYREWNVEPTVGRWYTHMPNYYFPKMSGYSDFKTVSLVFLISLVGLLFLISPLTIFLYRMGSRARRQRDLQDQLQSISDLLDVLPDEVFVEEVVIDDPPSYEPPPNYEDAVTSLNKKNTGCDVTELNSKPETDQTS